MVLFILFVDMHCKLLRKAMKGMGCDKKTVAEVTGSMNANQRVMVRHAFRTVDQVMYSICSMQRLNHISGYDSDSKVDVSVSGFLEKMLRFLVVMLTFLVKVLRFLVQMLCLVKVFRFLERMVEFVVKVLRFLVKMLRFSVSPTWIISKNVQILLKMFGFVEKMVRFLVKKLRFLVQVLRFSVKMLGFLEKMLRFLEKMLRFLVKMLAFCIKCHFFFILSSNQLGKHFEHGILALHFEI